MNTDPENVCGHLWLPDNVANLGAGRIRDILETWALQDGAPVPAPPVTSARAVQVWMDPRAMSALREAAIRLTHQTGKRRGAGFVASLIVRDFIDSGRAAFPR